MRRARACSAASCCRAPCRRTHSIGASSGLPGLARQRVQLVMGAATSLQLAEVCGDPERSAERGLSDEGLDAAARRVLRGNDVSEVTTVRTHDGAMGATAEAQLARATRRAAAAPASVPTAEASNAAALRAAQRVSWPKVGSVITEWHPSQPHDLSEVTGTMIERLLMEGQSGGVPASAFSPPPVLGFTDLGRIPGETT